MGEEEFAALRARYLVSGLEEGESGTPHLQMYVEFSSPQRMSAIKKVLGSGIHCEVARGKAQEAANYCMKDNTFVEFGELRGQGARNDLIGLRDALASGKRGRELLDADETAPAFFKYQRGIAAAVELYDVPPVRRDVEVSLYFGPPGTGKSTRARLELPRAYHKDNTRWWPGYSGEESVIWDEFGGWSLTPSDYNRIFDAGQMHVEIKGASVALRATQFIIISNYTPESWWNTEKVRVLLSAVTRRIHKFFFFQELGVPPRLFESWDSFSAFIRTGRGDVTQ